MWLQGLHIDDVDLVINYDLSLDEKFTLTESEELHVLEKWISNLFI